MTLRDFDIRLIHAFRSLFEPLARFGLFLVFFWFGALKVVGLSPASPLVQQLFERTIPVMEFGTFIVLFGALECLIGLLFLWRGAERVAIPLLFVHMATTLGPLLLLPEVTWTGFMVPTLEGQYIIKNVLLVAAAVGIASHLHPIRK
ncbi:MAG TPA: hypothetical protein VJJ47_02965 [Candidatus Paceibacterota bacterium]